MNTLLAVLLALAIVWLIVVLTAGLPWWFLFACLIVLLAFVF